MPPVNSSNLSSVEYTPANGDTPSELVVQFHNSRIYGYAGVPREVYEGLLSAASPGQYFNANVKNAYPATRKA